MTLRRAMYILGIPRDSSKEYAMKAWKRLTVEYRKTGDDESCKVLSEVKQKLKRFFGNRCLDCGVRIKPRDTRCLMHANVNKFYGRSLRT